MASHGAHSNENATGVDDPPYKLNVMLGSELLAMQKTAALDRPVKIETGCTVFDDLLQGRIRPGLISLVGQDDGIVTMVQYSSQL